MLFAVVALCFRISIGVLYLEPDTSFNGMLRLSPRRQFDRPIFKQHQGNTLAFQLKINDSLALYKESLTFHWPDRPEDG